MCRSDRRCPSSANSARTRALNTANKRVERARNALVAAKAGGDHEQITAAEQRTLEALLNQMQVASAHPLPKSDRGHDTPDADTRQQTAAPVEHPSVTGRGNLTITGHTGPLNLHHNPAADINGNVTITGNNIRIDHHTPQQQADHGTRQAEHHERVRAQIDDVHRKVADAQRRAREAAAAGAGDPTVVNGDGRVTVNGVAGGVSITGDPSTVQVGRVTGEVWINGRRVR